MKILRCIAIFLGLKCTEIWDFIIKEAPKFKEAVVDSYEFVKSETQYKVMAGIAAFQTLLFGYCVSNVVPLLLLILCTITYPIVFFWFNIGMHSLYKWIADNVKKTKKIYKAKYEAMPEIIARTKKEEEEICDCACHDGTNTTMHFITCCEPCPRCKENIKPEYWGEHSKTCKEK